MKQQQINEELSGIINAIKNDGELCDFNMKNVIERFNKSNAYLIDLITLLYGCKSDNGEKYADELQSLINQGIIESDNTCEIKSISVSDLGEYEVSKNLFQDNDSEAIIRKNMKENGFDNGYPVLATYRRGEVIVFEGHTRLRIAKEIDKKMKINVCVYNNISDDYILELAVSAQHAKRTSSDSVLIRSIELIYPIVSKQAKKHQGTRNDLINNDPQSGGVAAVLSLKFNCGKSKIKEAVRVIKNETYLELVKNGELSIHEASTKLTAENKLNSNKVKINVSTDIITSEENSEDDELEYSESIEESDETTQIDLFNHEELSNNSFIEEESSEEENSEEENSEEENSEEENKKFEVIIANFLGILPKGSYGVDDVANFLVDLEYNDFSILKLKQKLGVGKYDYNQ